MALGKLKDLEIFNIENIVQRINSAPEEAANMEEQFVLNIDDEGEFPPWNCTGAGSSRLVPVVMARGVFNGHLLLIKDQLTGEPSKLNVMDELRQRGSSRFECSMISYISNTVMVQQKQEFLCLDMETQESPWRC